MAKHPKWTPKKVKGKIQRARTYAPGWDVICVRAPSPMIDRIRSEANKRDISISALVCSKFGKPSKKKTSAQKIAKPTPVNGAAKPAEAQPSA